MTTAARPWGQRGATRLELAVACSVSLVLAGMLLISVNRYQAECESVAAKQLISSLRTSLAVRSAKIVSTTGEAGLMAVAHQNPMTWLQHPPENYLGEYYSPKKEALPRGNWYFDRKDDSLVFLPARANSFSPGTQKILVFKVKLFRVSSPVSAGRQEKGSAGLVLEQFGDQAVAFNNIAGSLPPPHFSEKQ